ncbi:hypothetical protein KIW84_042155 [Lathyrus oleraceus]|uniref:Tf2-1-like SH3-like domain-containing protein n=1 Tax=Pisum sativum TaxID=3888 RepID=A0A9D5AT16_PEA|nr:hypothetical protein KIW84_042155 [Pisum sativum]
MTPFEALYGRPPPLIAHYSQGESKIGTLNDLLTKRQQVLAQLKNNLIRAQNRMLHPYRQLSVKNRASQKLSKRFYGLLRILKRSGHVAYELELPLSFRIHQVFHVSLLKLCHGELDTQICQILSHPTTVVERTQLELEATFYVVDLGDNIPLNRGGNDMGQTNQPNGNELEEGVNNRPKRKIVRSSHFLD